MSLASVASLCIDLDGDDFARRLRAAAPPAPVRSLEAELAPHITPAWWHRVVAILQEHGPMRPAVMAMALNEPGVRMELIEAYLQRAVHDGRLMSARIGRNERDSVYGVRVTP